MGVKGLTWGGPILIIFLSGCEGKGPDRATIGGTVRQVGLSYLGERREILLPVGEIRLTKEITPHLDGQARLQFVSQPPVVIPTMMVGGVKLDEVKGNFQSLGFNLNYFSWKTRAIGMEVGVEMFRAEYKLLGIADRFWGEGVNLGRLGEIPLSQLDGCRLVWGGGYNFTGSTSEATIEKVGVDLDGWYGTLALAVEILPGK